MELPARGVSTDVLSLGQFPALSRRSNLERLLSCRWTVRLAAVLPFVVVLFLVRISLPLPEWLWDALVFGNLLWAVLVFLYSLLLVLGVAGTRCPRCSGRYGADDSCSKCGLPRHFAITPR